jgi:competence protein ComEA
VEPSSAPWRVLETTDPAHEPETPSTGPATRGLPWPAVGIALIAVAIAVAAAAIMVTTRGEPVIGVEGAVGLDAGFVELGGTRPMDPASPAVDLVVDVGGAVAHPGVYRLPEGSRVADAIEAAGGYGGAVDAALVDRQVNLAATVRDGEKIRVPARGDAAMTGGSGGGGSVGGSDGSGSHGALADAGPVDLNHASAEALDTLPGVGPATVAKIMAARDKQPFATVDDLLARKVVGAATMEKLRALVTVGP